MSSTEILSLVEQYKEAQQLIEAAQAEMDDLKRQITEEMTRRDETRVLKAIAKLPDEGDRKQMKGHPGFFRLRVGDYRIIYTVDNGQLIVRVVDAGNRGQIYNRY